MRGAAWGLGAAIALGAAPALAAEPAPGGANATGDPVAAIVFSGACDVSAAVPLGDGLFAAADDEDSVIRIYDARRGGAPVSAVDLAPALGLAARPDAPEAAQGEGEETSESDENGASDGHAASDGGDATDEEGDDGEKGGKHDGKKGRRAKQAKKARGARGAPETDIEAAVRVGELAYWMSSHARNRSGERETARLRFFATSAPVRGDGLALVGRAYEGLLERLLADPRLARFELAAAAELAPKDPGGLNLEGLAAREEGGLWIGFRNPVPGGRALLVPLLNPERVIEGEPARFGDAVLLDLGGLGVRALGESRGRGLIVAGPFADGGSSRLFEWDGRGAPRAVPGVALDGLNPEAIVSFDEGARTLVLSDDGTLAIDGKECKRLKDPARKRFRGAWLALPAAAVR